MEPKVRIIRVNAANAGANRERQLAALNRHVSAVWGGEPRT